MKFIFNTIIWGLATFMIFAHQYMGKDYFFIIGSTVLFLNMLRGYERGAAVGKMFFSVFLFLVLGSLGLLVYLYRDHSIDNLNQLVGYLYGYGVIYFGLAIIAFIVYLFKMMVTDFHDGAEGKIENRNHEIYMTNSAAQYQSKEQADQKVSRVVWLCDLMVILFIVLTTYLLFGFHLMKIKFETIDFQLNMESTVIICSCWLGALFYFFNVGIKFLLYAVVFHCIVCAVFHSSLFQFGLLSETGLIQLAKSIGYIFLPSVIIFFVREMKIITSFKDY